VGKKSAADQEDAMNKMTMSGAIVSAIAGTLMSSHANAGPIAGHGLRLAIEHPLYVACRSHGHHASTCEHVVRHTDNPTVRLDESGSPDSRRRFSRW
jgi:hypothetical protein